LPQALLTVAVRREDFCTFGILCDGFLGLPPLTTLFQNCSFVRN
jgi:hypothetical protein